ncbi:MAG: LysM peptidoglycan-binding domain-containing protein [Anaerolineae bacterium]|nr:LysM peptidoglycan-binding domain-containing protein [Anaerolineae bacterium]
MVRTLCWMLLGMLILSATSGGVLAQDNLLRNPGLEESGFGIYAGQQGRSDLNIPVGWGLWLADGPRDADKPWMNRPDKTFAFPHRGPDPNPHGGVMALNLSAGFSTSTNAVFQQVTVADKSPLHASAWVWIHTCTLPKNSQSTPTSPTCGSSPASEAFVKIGIDPNGGTDPFAPEILWSALAAPHDQWLQISADVTSTGTSATVFLYSTQRWAADLNNVYWDDVSLTVGGAGGAAPGATLVPTAPPYVAFVVPQGAQSDGSIVHRVQPGDTIDSIAYAYGVTRTQILELNNISDPRLIFVGQELRVSLPQTTGAGNEPTAAAPESTNEVPGETVVEPSPVPPIVQVEPTSAGAPVEATTAPVVVEATAVPQPSGPTAIPATAPVVAAAAPQVNPASQTGSVCVLLFDDKNQNRLQEADEALLAGGTIAVNTDTQAIGSYSTDGVSDPYCFTDLAAGNYTAVAGAPSGYGLTTPGQFRLQLLPGATIHITFGAAEGVQPVLPPPADTGSTVNQQAAPAEAPRSTAEQLLQYSGLIIFGLAAMVLIGGIGLTLLLRRR